MTVDSSNLPASLQVAAAQALQMAFELHDSDDERIELFVALFSEIYPDYKWNVAYDYEHLYYIGEWYIRMRINGYLVFTFSSKS